MAYAAIINETSRTRAGTRARLSPQCNLLKKGHIMADSHPIPTSPRFQDITNRVFHEWTVLSFESTRGHRARWMCRCSCGHTRVVLASELTSGGSRSCGRCNYNASDDAYFAKLRHQIQRVAIIAANGCWLWPKVSRPNEYGRLRFRGLTTGAHVVSHRVFLGNEGDSWVLHTCDNRACVNPNHLFLGTCKDNIDDMVAKQRHASGARNGTAVLTAESVQLLRTEYSQGGVTQRALAAKYGIHQTTVSLIVRRKLWPDLPVFTAKDGKNPRVDVVIERGALTQEQL